MENVLSTDWKQKEGEDGLQYDTRIKLLEQGFHEYKRKHGSCYMVKFGENDVRPMWEDQIDITKLAKEILSPVGMPLDCPVCQPYDIWDPILLKMTRYYMCKVINPRFPEGFMDTGGVWRKCACILKGEHYKRLKFIGQRRIS